MDGNEIDNKNEIFYKETKFKKNKIKDQIIHKFWNIWNIVQAGFTYYFFKHLPSSALELY
jgi:hypothetical protein